MENKNMPFIVASCASLVCLLFLPFIAYKGDNSLWAIFTEAGVDAYLKENVFIFVSIYGSLVAGIFAVVGGFINKILYAKWGALAAVGCLVLYSIKSLIDGASIIGILDGMGIGYWLAIIGFVVSAKMAKAIEE